MSIAYTPADRTDFGTAVATAAAALVGLLFVAISVNLKNILDEQGLPSRAAQTLILYASALIVAVLLVVPGQGFVATGLELVATGLVILAAQLYLDLTTEGGDEETFWRRMVGRVFPSVISCSCITIAGATLLAQAGGGLYWVVPAVVTAIIFGLTKTWVLLVEILR